MAAQIGMLLLRGPHCQRYTWFGYQGGIESRKRVVDEQKRRKEEEEKAKDEKASIRRSNESAGSSEDVKRAEPEGEKVGVEAARKSGESMRERKDPGEVV